MRLRTIISAVTTSVALLTGASTLAGDPTTAQALQVRRFSTLQEAATISRQPATIQLSGRAVRITLQANRHLTAQLRNVPDNTSLYRGELPDIPGSWVRLTQTGSGTEGLIWDGTDLYAIAPATAVAAAAGTTGSVIFKLADAVTDLPADYCGTSHTAQSQVSGQAAYLALTAELNSITSTPDRRLEIQALADAAFRAQYSSDEVARQALLVRLNNVDGIFSQQLQLSVQATSLVLYSSDPPGLSNSTDSGTLLSSVASLRRNSPVMQSYAATHLFTGRDLDGDTLGIAYIGQLCGARYAASLSEVRSRGTWIDSLVLAHELGHQLGADHDGSGSCASTPSSSYLMSAFINGTSTFSSCSLGIMMATKANAACLVPIAAADIALRDAVLQALINQRFNWIIPINNTGDAAAGQTSITVQAPSGIVIESATLGDGSCLLSSDQSQVSCNLSSLAARESRGIVLTLLGTAAGTYTLTGTALADAESSTDNNRARYVLTLISPSDTALPDTASATTSSADAHGGGTWSPLLLALIALTSLRRGARGRQH